MVATTLSQSILAGMDPGTYRNIQDIQNGEDYLKVGQDASPTTKMGAVGRLANALAGAYIQNSSISDLAKATAAGKKQSLDDILAAVSPKAATAIPSAPPALAPAARSITPAAAPVADAQPAAPVPVDPGSPNAQVANRFPASMSPGSAISPLPNDAPSPLDTAQYPAGPGGAPSQVADAGPVAAIDAAMQPRGIRNNNALNIEDGPFAKSQAGYAGSDGRFAKFATPEHGVAAAGALLDNYDKNHGLNTVAGIVNRWAPPTDGNNTMAYASDVAGKLGIDPNAPVPPELRPQLIAAMAQHENGKATPGTAAAAPGAPGAPVQLASAAPQTMNDADPEAAPAAKGQQVAEAGSLDVHKLMAVLQNPYADDTTKQLAQKLLLQQLTPKEDEFGSAANGVIYNKRTGDVKSGGAAVASQFGNLQGPELMDAVKQQNPSLAAQAQGVIEGRIPYPTGSRLNPQQQQLKEIVTQIDPTFEAGTSKARMKMQADLAASGNSNMGGILSNGKSSFSHLADLSDTMSNLGNYNGPDIPGGSHIAAVGNYVGNQLLPTSATKGKETSFNQNALKYGEESTKFYSGSGGGEAERMNALKTLNPSYTSGDQQAAFLRTEKGLMLDRLTEKERQIRDVMGQDYLDKHPVMTPELQGHVKRIDTNIAKLEGTAPANDKGTAPSTAAAAAPAAPKVIGSQQEYEALPSGSSYVAPDGSVRTKK